MPNAARTGLAQRAAEAQLAAASEELVGLLATAAEGVRDAANDTDTAQAGKHLVDRPAGVQKNRQTGVAGNSQLFKEKVLLACEIGLSDQEIEANLTDCNRYLCAVCFLLQPAPQLHQILLASVADEKGMNAIRRNAAGMLLATVAHCSKIGGAQRRDDECCDADCPGSGDDRRAILGERAGRQMAMRVDQHGLGLCSACRQITQDGLKRRGFRHATIRARAYVR